ncbi:MAG TPA: hypothetical protein VI322_04740 [Candidatus Saccharimonadia bacterium]
MPETNSTKLTVRPDRPTAISSSGHGANVNAMAFNVPFIALYNPRLAIEIIKLYDEAHAIDENYQPAPEEDYALFNAELKEFMDDRKNHSDEAA